MSEPRLPYAAAQCSRDDYNLARAIVSHNWGRPVACWEIGKQLLGREGMWARTKVFAVIVAMRCDAAAEPAGDDQYGRRLYLIRNTLEEQLAAIHAEMVKMDDAFYAIPEQERRGGPKDQPIREWGRQLDEQADRLLNGGAPDLPPGFRWGHTLEEGEVAHGFLIIPDSNSHPELWGKLVRFEDAEAILAPYGLEIKPTTGDFFLARVGTNHVRDVARRVRLIGPADQFEQIAHLFTQPEGRSDHR